MHCVICGSQSLYDEATGNCECPVNHKRIEIYNTSTLIPEIHECLACPAGTAVIDTVILEPGQRYHATAGAFYEPDPHTCKSCPDSNMIFDEGFNCICREGFVMTGEKSIGTQFCVNKKVLPSITSSYSKVKFYSISSSENNKIPRNIEIDSIVLSHYYLKVASTCEFSNGSLKSTRNACQCLANLCVLSSYDETAASCRQLALSLRNDQQKLRQNIVYEDNTIIRDRSIQMQMSLKEKKGFEHTLDLKVAKYSIEGEFIGFQNLENHFIMPCIGSEASLHKGVPSKGATFKFGKPFSTEHKCSLADLVQNKVYFYELFIVDKRAQCGSEDSEVECLYPVPVVISNNGGIHHDKIVSRFVFVDNMVSRRSFFSYSQSRLLI